MPQTRNTINALRVASLWLVALSVLIGPLGVGAAIASSALKTCGVSCPCDEEQHADAGSHEGNPCEGGSASEHGEKNPCGDECPDDCPDCSCCVGLTIGVAPVALPSLPGLVSSSRLLQSPDAPVSSDIVGIFRPPRFLT